MEQNSDIAPSTNSFSPAEFQAAKKELQNTLSRVQSLVIRRKDLYDSAKAKSKGVTLQLRPLVSQSGNSLDSYRAKAATLSAADPVSEIRKGLVQIESLLNDDIEILKRLSFGR